MSQLIQLLIVARKTKEWQERADKRIVDQMEAAMAAEKESSMNVPTKYQREEQMDPQEIVVVPEDTHRRDENDRMMDIIAERNKQRWENFHEWLRRANIASLNGDRYLAERLIAQAWLEVEGLA